MAKGIMIIDGQRVPFDGEKNVLAVIRKAGIEIPTFCYYSELSTYGACRMCMVEDVKTGKLDASCSMEPRDGMEIRTNTAKLLKHRRMILELLLAAHDCSCTTCNKSGNCRLQELAQRFGVRHKEKLKALKKNVDVLTLTATPIPRTLQLSMSGIRDLSVIETAPQDRKPVATAVLRRDDVTLRTVLERELAREGQVFWVYNRVQGLERVAEYVRKLVPTARVGMAHGQMSESELESNMHKFWHGELDVLVCTAIVESGLDFPRANTLVVDQAQLFGLGQLYQLRGRVGRSDRQAYAFFVVPDTEHLSEVAEERLRIIMDMDYLGAGFQVAMEDLRLRGAGNILGEVQSGHMGRVGLDLYLEMLEEAVARLKGTPVTQDVETELNLGLPAHIPQSYIEDGRERLRCYKALTSATSGAAREEVALSMRDRFGSFPQELVNFIAVLDFKQFLSHLQVQRADIYLDHVRLVWGDGQTAVQPERILQLVASMKGARMLPPASLMLPLPADKDFAQGLQGLRQALENIRTPGSPGGTA